MIDVCKASEEIPSLHEYQLRQPDHCRVSGGSRRNKLEAVNQPIEGLVSIITVTFNSVRTLERTINSISAQTYPAIEYIIIDGGSSDGTLELIRSREREISLYTSGPDAGISDAFNMGIALARGEFVAIVNSDDWIEADHVQQAVLALRNNAFDFVFGDIQLHQDDGTPAGHVVGSLAYQRKIRHMMQFINHQSMVCRWQTYSTFGLYRLEYRNAMDYDWFLRVTLRGGRGLYVPEITSHVSLAGVSDREFNRSLAEVRGISITYGYPAILANLRFCFRVVRGTVRRALANAIPLPLYERIRTFINAGYRSSSSR